MIRIACVALVLTGCLESHKKPPCPVFEAVPDIELRNPDNGQCQSFGGGFPCDNNCGPCPGVAGSQEPDWGQCFAGCDGLAESQCVANAQCHAAYQDDSQPNPVFWGCWNLPPSGALTGTCTNLDAQTCSEHTDCVSIYTGPVNQPPNFVPSFISCQAEVAAPACTTLTTETSCKARPDCDAVYDGMNCTCDSSGCTCATETYAHCEPR